MGKKWLGRVQAGLYGVVNGRFCIALLLVFVMECIMVDGTSEFLREWNLRITPWMLPHYFSDGLFRVYYGFIVCYMYADVPFMSRSEMQSRSLLKMGDMFYTAKDPGRSLMWRSEDLC